ncbi:MAG: hypothetical protein LBV07_05305 [Syntrophobacterales bacterium]|jgi:hypothetical protein|nr:hypothetical protein [Syntrophobacterales bacterium]
MTKLKQMKIIVTILLFLSINHIVLGQENSLDKILSKEEIKLLFPDSVKTKFNIQYPIRRVCSYSDKSGNYLMAFTERFDGIADGDTICRNIKAFHFKLVDNQLEKVIEINDAVVEGEPSIWFWTKYCQFTDIDKDGLVEPIIVYGASYEDLEKYRVKILIYYKGKKYAIRHQNCDLDFCRSTQIDKDFYDLPLSIIEQVKSIMRKLEENNHAYFGHWEHEMKRRAVKF